MKEERGEKKTNSSKNTETNKSHTNMVEINLLGRLSPNI